ncbi:MAG: hypothetical protein P8M20_12805 [Planctomycetaceae bacterium]|nr:hypothetical protein [Planctomycetaceae bacterium]
MNPQKHRLQNVIDVGIRFDPRLHKPAQPIAQLTPDLFGRLFLWLVTHFQQHDFLISAFGRLQHGEQ